MPTVNRVLATAVLPVILCVFIVSCGDGGESGIMSSDPSAVAPSVEISLSTPESFEGTVRIPGVGAFVTEHEGINYHQLRVLHGGQTGVPGEPDIPYVVYLFALPRLRSTGLSEVPEVRVTASDPAATTGIVVYPSQEPPLDRPLEEIQLMPDPPFVKDDALYTREEPYPADLFQAEVLSAGHLSVLAVKLYPLQFLPADRTIRLFRRLDIEIDMNPAGADIEPATAWEEVDGEGALVVSDHPYVEDLLLNRDAILTGSRPWVHPDDTASGQVYDDPLFHILTVADYAFLDAARVLQAHKHSLGWRVKLVGTASIDTSYGSHTAQDLRRFLQDQYLGNGDLGLANDPDEPGVPQDRDFYTVRVFKRRPGAGSSEHIAVNVFLRSTYSDTLFEVDFDTNADGTPELRLECGSPYDTFTINATSAPDVFDSLVWSGTPTVRSDSIMFEFPWEDVFGGRDRVSLKISSGMDLVPDSGSIGVHWKDIDPSLRYLILMGDAEHIPVTYDLCTYESLSAPDADHRALPVGSDHYYADLTGDIFPEIAVGRLPVDTPEEAENAVGKIAAYETDDPFAGPTTPQVATAGQFEDGIARKIVIPGTVTWDGSTVEGPSEFYEMCQGVVTETWQDPYVRIEHDGELTPWLLVTGEKSDTEVYVNRSTGTAVAGTGYTGVFDGRADRPFIDTAEQFREFFDGMGIFTVRYYAANLSQTRPLRYLDDRPLPPDLQIPSYGWNSSGSDLVTEFSAHRNLLFLHRDHGGIEGWGTPWFRSSEVSGVTAPADPESAVYPLVLSINCASGYFDNETDFFVYGDGSSTANTTWWSASDAVNLSEAFLRHEGAAAAVIAPTRLSQSYRNDTLVTGLAAAMYPGYPLPPSLPAPFTDPLPAGDVFNRGKSYLYFRMPVLGEGDLLLPWPRHYMELYHLFGDPSMRLWRFPGPP